MLLLLTIVTGLIDAVSYLALGHVFVANMTGNVVFLGFALAGAEGFSAPASLAALAAFLVGAFAGGRLRSRFPTHRGRLLAATVTMHAVLTAAGVVIALLSGRDLPTGGRYALILLLGIGMGLQNAVARHISVPDLTTTVLTLTLTGLAADARAAGGAGSRLGRRTASAASMFLGALAGGLLVLRAHLAAALGLALLLLIVVALAAGRARGSEADWTRPPSTAA